MVTKILGEQVAVLRGTRVRVAEQFFGSFLFQFYERPLIYYGNKFLASSTIMTDY